jgi:O-methyltransferase involved in polyketide biosynthesis
MTTPFDSTKPNTARIYDYWLGGKDNFEVDRRAAEAVRSVRPDVAEMAVANRQFQTRAVTYAAGQGVRQFLDVGSGLPTSPVRVADAEPVWLPTHEAVRAVIPDALVAYVDNDPVAVLHSGTLLADGSREVVTVLGDMRDPAAVVAHDDVRQAGFDPGAPACVVLGCVLHFTDAATARAIVSGFAGALAAGSYVIISVGYGRGRAGEDFASAYNAQDGTRIYSHSLEEITAMFTGLELIPPGIAEAAAWRPGREWAGLPDRSNMILAGVGRSI